MTIATLFRAVRRSDLDQVRALAAQDPGLVRATDPGCFGTTPLICAADAGDRAMLDLLLSLGADINQRSDWWAGGFGVLDGCDDATAAYLLSRGATLTPHAAARLGKADDLRAMLAADPSLVHARGGDGQTPLHFARAPEVADLLLAHGAAIDALDIDHASTPAQWLTASRPETAAHLVSRGAAPDPFLAARTGGTALLDRLLKAEPDGVNVRISRARFPTNPPAAGHIYLYTIGESCSLAHAAAGANQPAIIHWLADHSADLNARGGYDDGTPLHTAAWADRPETAAALIDRGADLNAPSGQMHDNEPIGWAIVSGAVNTFQVLRDRGATLRQAHLQDARAGAAGAFAEINRRRPRDAWREIARRLGV